MIAIIAAMKEEVARLGKPSENGTQVTVTGVGKEKVLTAVTSLLQTEPHPSLILSLGFSGALSDELNTGDLILARKIFLAESESFVEVSGEYYTLAEKTINEKALPYVRRDSVTVPNLVRTRSEKDELARTYNCHAVNMEDYWVGFAAIQAGIPFLSVRAILDMTHQELPAFIEELVWDRKRRQGLRVILSSLARPTRIPKLMSLAKQSRKAQESLGAFAASFVAKAVAEGVCSPA